MSDVQEFQLRKVSTVSGGHFIHDVYSGFLPPLLPLLIDKFSLTMVLAGMLTLFFRLPSLFNPFLGAASDRMNFGRLFALGPGLTAVSMTLLGAAPNYVFLALLLITAGCSAAVYHVVGPVLAARFSGVYIGRGMSFWMTAGEAARTAAPIIAVAGVERLGLTGLWPLSVVGVGVSVYLWFAVSTDSAAPAARSADSLLKVWRGLLPVMLPLTWLLTVKAFIVANMVNFLPAYLTDRGESLLFGGTALAVLEGAGILGAFLGGRISDTLGRRAVLFVVFLIAPAVMLLFVNLPGLLTVPLVGLTGLFVFAQAPVMMALVQDHARGNRGAANGLYMGLNFCITAAVLVFTGALVDTLGFQTGFSIAAGAGFLGLPAVFLLPRRG